ATLITKLSNKYVPPLPPHIRPQPLRRHPMPPLAETPPCASLHFFLGATGSASALEAITIFPFQSVSPAAPGSARGQGDDLVFACFKAPGRAGGYPRKGTLVQLLGSAPTLHLPQVRLLEP